MKRVEIESHVKELEILIHSVNLVIVKLILNVIMMEWRLGYNTKSY